MRSNLGSRRCRVRHWAAVTVLFSLAAVPMAARAQTFQWIRQFGAAGNNQGRGIAVDASGVYVAGSAEGALPGQTSAGGFDAFVRKYDRNGNEQWTRQFGTARFDDAYAVAVDASGVYVVGRTDGALPGQISAGGFDAFVRKYDANGNEQWTRQFGSGNKPTLSIYDAAQGVAASATGVYVVGFVSDALPGQTSSGGNDAFVRKYDANGNEQWTRQFGSANSDRAFASAADASGVYVAGDTGQTSTGFYDALVRKYDPNGSEQWTRQFGSARQDDAYGVAVDATGVYVVGEAGGSFPGQTNAGVEDAFVQKYDPNGNELWTRQFGTSATDRSYGVAVDATSVYVVGETGGALPGQTSFGVDAFMRKYDREGAEQGILQFSFADDESARGIALDDVGGLYVGGETSGTLPGQTRSGSSDAFVVKLSGTIPCSYAIVPTNRSFSTTGGSGTVSVSAPTGCAWAATSNSSFVTLQSGSAGSANGIVSYSVSENVGSDSRTGTLSIAGLTFTVTQDGTLICSYSISPRSALFSASGGSGTVSVTTSNECVWTATSSASFLTVTSGSSSGGIGTVAYSVATNPNSIPRSATLTVAGQTVTVTQDGTVGCTYLITPTSQSFSASGGSGTVSVTATSGCGWTALSNASFLTITSGSSGSGNGTVAYSVAENTTASRTGTLTIAGQTLTVAQAGAAPCTYSISPSSQSFSASGGNGTVNVTTASGCFWTTLSNASFLTITSAGAGTGNGTVGYSVAENTNPSSRTGTLTIAGQTFTVTQAGAVPAPVLFEGGVVNGASFAPSPAPLAPGSLAAVFGSNLNDGSTVLSSSLGTDGKLVSSLGGASVTINNIPAPMFYSTPGQLGIQIPMELGGLTSATIHVTVGGQTSQPRTIFLDAVAPGIFTVSRDGRGAAAALHQDGITPVSAQSPARPGETVSLFATGLGTLTPPLPTGTPSTGNRTIATAAVTIDGIPGEVQFSGAAPGYVGLNQINVRIPLNTRAASDIPVVLSIGGKQSNSVTIAVAP